MNEIKIKDEYIKLGQAMKLSGLSGSGVEAKAVIQNGEVTVNNSVCLERGKKLHNGDTFEYKGTVIKVVT
ncbi:MAG: RNA-binding S4 domain-containing protein [Lachnospiraceae bacterium]|nr:RNA-binding S4 domain-containing protein [Lachnospiraceae bacterium]